MFQRRGGLHPDRRAGRHHHGGDVFIIVIPNQRKTSRDAGGQGAQPVWGEEAKQRSVHNKLSHAAVVFFDDRQSLSLDVRDPFQWLIVATVLAIGPVIRHFFNSATEAKAARGGPGGRRRRMLAVAGLRRGAKPMQARVSTRSTPRRAEAIMSRCSMCHMSEPVWPGVHGRRKTSMLDSPENIRRMRI